MKRLVFRAVGGGALLFLAMQLVRPEIPRGGAGTEIQAPPEVRAVLARDCYACHSNEPRLSWFDSVQPVYGLARRDILAARSRLNFSTIGAQPPAAQRAALFEAVAMMRLGAMPLPAYTLLHREAKVSVADLEVLERFLAPWSTPLPPAPERGAPEPARAGGGSVAPSPNGLPYDAGWRNWRLLAVTDRGDNRQFRMIFGNGIAVEAARAGRVSPWPDGARLAKAAWLEERSAEGLIVPGRFWQVELMVKDSVRYRETEGWGWGRWRSEDLKPYGADAAVVRECTGCHRPMGRQDYVYTLPFSAAQAAVPEVLNAAAVRFPAGLDFDPLDWKPLTIFLDPVAGEWPGTISVLLAGPASATERALVTWTQRDDPYWFGARMADRVARVEVVRPGAGGELTYRRYDGEAAGSAPVRGSEADRARFLAELPPARTP